MLEQNSLKRLFLFVIMGYLCSGVLLTTLVSLPLFATYFQRYLVSVFVLGAEIFSSLALGHFILPKIMQRLKLKFTFLAFFLAFGCGLMALHVGPFDLFAGIFCTFLPLSYLSRLHFARQTPWMIDQQHNMAWFSVWIVTPVAVVLPILFYSLEGIFVSKIIFGVFALSALSLLLLKKYGNELMFNENSIYDVDPELFKLFHKRDKKDTNPKNTKDKKNTQDKKQDKSQNQAAPNEPDKYAYRVQKKVNPWVNAEDEDNDNALDSNLEPEQGYAHDNAKIKAQNSSQNNAQNNARQPAHYSDIWQDNENVKPIDAQSNASLNQHDDWGLNNNNTNPVLNRGNFVETDEMPFNPFEDNNAFGQAMKDYDSVNSKAVSTPAPHVRQADHTQAPKDHNMQQGSSHVDYLETNNFEDAPINSLMEGNEGDPSLDSPFGDGANPNAQGALDNSQANSHNPFGQDKGNLDNQGWDLEGNQISPFAVEALPNEMNAHNSWLDPNKKGQDYLNSLLPPNANQEQINDSRLPQHNQDKNEWDNSEQAQAHFNSHPNATLSQHEIKPNFGMAVNGREIERNQNPLGSSAPSQEIQDLIDAVPASHDPLSFTHLADQSSSPAFDSPLQQSHSDQHPATLMELENGNVPEWMHPNVSGGDGNVYATTSLLPGNMMQRPIDNADSANAANDPWAIGSSANAGQDIPTAGAGAKNPIDFLKAQVLGQSSLDPVSNSNRAKAPRHTLSQPELMSYTNLEIAEHQPKMSYTALDIENPQAAMDYTPLQQQDGAREMSYTQLERNGLAPQVQQDMYAPYQANQANNTFDVERTSQARPDNYQAANAAPFAGTSGWDITPNTLNNGDNTGRDNPYSGNGYGGDNRAPQYTNLEYGTGRADEINHGANGLNGRSGTGLNYTDVAYNNGQAQPSGNGPFNNLYQGGANELNYTDVAYGSGNAAMNEHMQGQGGNGRSGTAPTYTDVEYGARQPQENRNGPFNNLYQGSKELNYTDVEYGSGNKGAQELPRANGLNGRSGTAPNYTDVEYGARQPQDNRNGPFNNLYQGGGKELKHTNVEYGSGSQGSQGQQRGAGQANRNGKGFTYTNVEYGAPQPKQNRNAQFNNLYQGPNSEQSYSYTAANYGVVKNNRADNSSNVQYARDTRGIAGQRAGVLGGAGANGNRKLNYTNLEIATPQQRSNNRVTVGAQDLRDKKLAQIKEDQFKARGTQQTQMRSIANKDYNFGPERLSTKANHTVEIVSNGQVVAKVQGNNKPPVTLGPKTQAPKPHPKKEEDDEFEQELMEKLRYLRKKRNAGRNSIFIN